MGILDIIVIGVLLYNCIIGIKRGLIRIVLEFVALLLSVFLAFAYYKNIAVYIADIIKLSPFAIYAISFCAIWITTFAIISFISILLDKLIKIAMLGILNRLGGGFFGIAKGITLLVPILLCIVYVNLSFAEKSVLVRPFIPALKKRLNKVVPKLMNVRDKAKIKNIDIKNMNINDKNIKDRIQKIADENNLDLQSLDHLIENNRK
jgi:membrane protein required for colicin V production